jgi:hypothetical protein
VTVKKFVYGILLLANALVLLGMLWPEGMPPFAHTVNVMTLAVNLLAYALLMGAVKSKPKKA